MKEMPKDRWTVLFDIERERVAQDAKWGEQNHPDFWGTSPYWARAEDYSMPSAGLARTFCEHLFANGGANWACVLIEEVAEAIEAENEAHLREELVQCGAVIVAWVEAIDRRTQDRGSVLRDMGEQDRHPTGERSNANC